MSKTFEGTVENEHYTASFWYDIGRRKQTDELEAMLTQAAEERTQYLFDEGYVEGELNTVYKDTEIRGWATLKKLRRR